MEIRAHKVVWDAAFDAEYGLFGAYGVVSVNGGSFGPRVL